MGEGGTDQALIMGNILVHGFAAFSRFYSVYYTESSGPGVGWCRKIFVYRTKDFYK